MVQEKLIDSGEVATLLGVSKHTVWRLEKTADFPRRIQVSERKFGWKLAQINAWLKKKQVKKQINSGLD